MARKKSAEELMLEAELASAAGKSVKADGTGGAGAVNGALDEAKVPGESGTPSPHEDVALPDVAPAPTKRGGSRLGKRLKSPKVIAAIVVAIAVIVLAAVVISRVSFANSTDVWDGTADTSWYSENMTSMEVTSAEQLAGIRKLCNEGTSFEGVKFKLARNLDLFDIPAKPIGDGRQDGSIYHDFEGSFDGGGHTISGINIEEDMWDHAGLFGSVDGGDLTNLTVEGKVTGQVYVGGVVGVLKGGSITNCTNRCKVSSTKTATSFYPVSAEVGGVCGMWLGIFNKGREEARIENLVNEGDVSARACSAGGVVGNISNTDDATVRVSGLRNDGNVTVYCESEERDDAVGGVVGVVGSLGTDIVSDLVNNGEVSCSTVLSVGGVIGALMPPQRELKDDGSGSLSVGVQVSKCANTARVAANAADGRAHVGGIVGYLDDPEVVFEDCKNSGELAATNGKSDDIASTDGVEVWDKWEDEQPLAYV